MNSKFNKNMTHSASTGAAHAAATLFLAFAPSLASAAAVATQSANDPQTQLERARVASATGDYDKAQLFLKSVLASATGPVAAEARTMMAAIDRRLGHEQSPASQPSTIPAGASPVERRILEEIDRFQRGISKDSEMRSAIARLGEVAIPVLVAKISDPSTLGATRDELLTSLANIGGERAVDALEKWISTPGDELLSKNAAERLLYSAKNVSQEYKSSAALRVFQLKNPTIRAAGVYLLAQLRCTDIIKENLDLILKDPDENVRLSLARSAYVELGKVILHKLAGDKSVKVRIAFAGICSQLGGNMENGAELLQQLLMDESAEVRVAAIPGLYSRNWNDTDREKFVTIFEKYSTDPSSTVRAGLARAMRNCLGERSLPLILRFAVDSDSGVRREAFNAMGVVDSREVKESDIVSIRDAFFDSVRRFGFPRKDSRQGDGSQEWFRLISHAGAAVKSAASFEDLLQIFTQVPESLDWADGALVNEMFRFTFPGALAKACALFPKTSNTQTRRALLACILRIVNKYASDKNVDIQYSLVIPVLRECLGENPNSGLRANAFWTATALAQDALLPSILENPDLLSSNSNLEQLNESINDISARNPEFAWKVLYEAVRGGPKSKASEGSESSYMKCAAKLATRIDESRAADVAALLLNSEFRAKVLAMNDQQSLPRLVAGFVNIPIERRLEWYQKLWGLEDNMSDKIIYNSGVEKPQGQAFLIKNVLSNADTAAEGRILTAVQILGEKRVLTPEITNAVVALAGHGSPYVRIAVAEYCRAWNDKKAVPTARKLLKDAVREVRFAAAGSLGRLLSEEAAPDLIEALADDQDIVRKAAKEALEQIRLYHTEKKTWEDWYQKRGLDPSTAVQKLYELLDDKAEDVRLAAIDSLGTMKAREALPLLVERLKKAPAGVERDTLARAISKINQ